MITKEAAALITIDRSSTQMSDGAPDMIDLSLRNYLRRYYSAECLASTADVDLSELLQPVVAWNALERLADVDE